MAGSEENTTTLYGSFDLKTSRDLEVPGYFINGVQVVYAEGGGPQKVVYSALTSYVADGTEDAIFINSGTAASVTLLSTSSAYKSTTVKCLGAGTVTVGSSSSVPDNTLTTGQSRTYYPITQIDTWESA